MGVCRAADPSRQMRRRQAADGHAGGHEWRDVYLSTGCQWRYIPKDFPPRSTLHDYFTWWLCDGTLDRIHYALYVECREKAEREASPTACIIDSQSVQDRDGGIWLLATLFGQFPFLAKMFADSAYAGSIFHTALGKVLPNLKTEIVRR